MSYTKEDQLARSPGGNQRCPRTGRGKRVCDCASCVGRRSQKKGKLAQRETRKALRLKPQRWSSSLANEETWTAAHVRVEVKAGAQVKPIATRYVAARNQSDGAKAVGDPRPFMFLAVPDGSQALVVIRVDDLESVVAALLEEWAD